MPPTPKIDIHPKQKLVTSGVKAKVKFAFAAAEAGARFKCRLDKGPFKPCISPVTYEAKPGKHTFEVETIGPGGKVSKVTSWKFTVVRKTPD